MKIKGRASEIYTELLGMIGQLPENCMLPSIKKLQEKFHCGQAMIQEAAAKLESEGIIKIIPRKGLKVLSKITLQEDEDIKNSPQSIFPNTPPGFIEYKQMTLGTFGYVPEYCLKLVEAFNKKEKREAIVLEEFPPLEKTNWSEPHERPDIAFIPNSPVAAGSRNFSPYYFADISQMRKELKEKNFYPGFIETSPDGFNWGLNISLNSNVILYKNRNMKKAGLFKPDTKWTWPSIMEYAEKLAVPGKFSFFLVGYMNFIYHWGVKLVNPENGEIRLVPEEFSKPLEFLKEMIAKKKLCPYYTKTIKNYQNIANWLGKLPLSEMNTSTLAYYPELTKADDYGIAEMPVRSKGRSFLHGHTIAMNNTAYDFESCWDFMSFALSEEGQRIVSEYSCYTPSMKDIPSSKLPEDFNKVIRSVIEKSRQQTENYYIPRQARFVLECAIDRHLRYGGGLEEMLETTRKSCILEISKTGGGIKE